MAVPLAAYEGVLSEEIGQLAIGKLGIRLIVFDPKRQEIVKWIA